MSKWEAVANQFQRDGIRTVVRTGLLGKNDGFEKLKPIFKFKLGSALGSEPNTCLDSHR
jgi:NAD dependent epimerase/dehydratase family enzyme